MERYILKYLYDHSENPKGRRFIDYFKMQLDNRLYSFGMHDTENFEYRQLRYFEEIQQDKGIKALMHPRRRWRKLIEKINSKSDQRKALQSLVANEIMQQCKYKVLSIFNLRKETIEELNRNGIAVYHYGQPFFDGDVTYESKSLEALDAFIEELRYKDFNQLLTEENYEEIDAIFRDAVEEFKATDFDAVLVWTSEAMECKFVIDVFKEIGRPSITFQHGLPGPYRKIEESRASYLCVWGPEVRENYLKVGFDPGHVLIAGNARYVSCPTNRQMRCGVEDVLVLTSAPTAPHQHEWEWDKFSKQDRSLLVTYLYSVENVLKSVGVKRARLRPHPSVSRSWLAKYLDMDFYEIDNEDFIPSLSKATMCVGQLSSTVLEAMQHGVSYIVYEPSEDGRHGMNGNVLVPPFDGSDKYLQVANTEDDLSKMIQERYVPDVRLLDEYMIPFNGSVIKGILDER